MWNEIFNKTAAELDLTQEESSFVGKMAKIINKNPLDIVSTPYAFELGIHSYLEQGKGEKSLAAKLIEQLRLKCGFDRPAPGQPIFSTRALTEMQAVSLVLGSSEEEGRHPCRISYKDELAFSLEKNDGDFGTIDRQAKVSIVIQQPGDGEYTFDIPGILEAGYNTVKLSHSIKFKRKQVREHIRVETQMIAKFRFIKASKVPDRLSGGARFSATVVDVSGGGIALQSEEKYDTGDCMILSFTFAGESFYGIKGTVLRVKERKSDSAVLFMHQIKFLEIDESLREKLIRKVFSKHREDVEWQRSVGRR
ncbi:MAG: PilZ domain-containing protein [Fibrobacteres bacterium]|nr:PilZ domain-containing protein [Fibrobacterota bacterium]